jgi:hypothetical protein
LQIIQAGLDTCKEPHSAGKVRLRFFEMEGLLRRIQAGARCL